MSAPDTAFVRQFKDQITHLVQQRDHRLGGTTMVDMDFKGEMKSYDQLGSIDMVEILGRYQDTPIQNPNHQRRSVTPSFFVSSTLEDPKDALQMLVDPKSPYMEGKRMAVNRKKDDVLIAAMGGSALTGKLGTSTQAFAAASQIAVTYGSGASNSGMTKAKVLRAKKLLDGNEADDGDRHAGATSNQFEDLLNITEVVSSDYNTVKALVEGSINSWVGFKWHRSERFLTNGSSHRLCYFWQKNALTLSVQKDAQGSVDKRVDKNMAWQVYMCVCLGSVRMQEELIIEVACAES